MATEGQPGIATSFQDTNVAVDVHTSSMRSCSRYIDRPFISK